VSALVPAEVETMTGPEALPRDNGELVFTAPWEGRALAMAVALVQGLGLEWDVFRRRLIAAIADQPGRGYYESWAVALEDLVLALELTSTDELAAATPTERPVL
jgi:hypothetical protein